MCTRQKALQYVITNGSGIKTDLVKHISAWQYEEFVSVGLIREPVKMHGVNAPEFISRDWVATPLAYKRAVELNLKAVRELKFKSNRKSLKTILF